MLSQFDPLWGAMAVARQQLEQKHARRKPDVVYHFTSLDGLIGILQGKSIWASNAFCLNDMSEVLFGLKTAKQLYSNAISHDQDSSLVAKVVPLLEPCCMTIGQDKRSCYPFVVSFSEDVKSSFQWLHYGRNGSGVAIAFDPTGVDLSGLLPLSPVIYERAAQESFLADLLLEFADVQSWAMNHALFGSDNLTSLVVDYISESLALEVFEFASRCKTEAFRSEVEWRMMIIRLEDRPGDNPEHSAVLRDAIGDKTRYRLVNGRVVPYLEVKYKAGLPINKIILGASCPIGKDDPGLRILLRETLGSDVPTDFVVESDVLVRP